MPHTGTSLDATGTLSYACTNGTKTSGSTNGGTTAVKNENLAKGTKPEIMVGKKGSGTGAVGGTFTAVIPLDNISGTLTLTYYQNKNTLKVSSTTTGVSGGQTLKPDSEGQQTTTFTGITADMTSITIVFEATTTSNVRLDDIVLTGYKAASATALAVKTAPTKVNYKKGETLDLTGLVLDATVGGDHVDITSGYTASPANGATLNSVGAQTVTFTYGGQNTTQTIHVGDLESIALTTTGVKITYDEGQSFDPTNLVVTATYSDGETTATTWTEDVDLEDCTFDPDGTLETTDDNVEVSYTWGSTEKTANIEITVNAASAYTVTFNAGTGSCGTSSLTEASPKAGVTLPTATIGVTGWSFAGWATASTTNTETEPTLYAAGDTYKPTEDCTLYAVYKFTEVSTTTYKRATSVSDITGADKIVIAYNDGKVLNTSINLSTTLTETSGEVTPASNAIFTLSGNNTDGYTLTNGTNTIGATGTGTSLTIALSSTNNLWTFSASTYGTNHFNVNNKGASGKSLEVYSSAWKAYALTASGQAWAMRIYVPAEVTVYNSNPAAIVNPTIAWTTSGDKSLYLQNTNTYDNAANVTGISKTPVYTSSDATVATVNEAGVVTALKAGSTTITAKVAKEVGVNTEASVTYDVTVKDASNVAGIKAITSSSSVVTFTADLTDAVVTYVKDNHAFIQDASGAVYASCGSSLTAGKKINGAVSGSVKAANQIDEITAISLASATVTDGVIPSASVISAATLAANKADYEGKLVSIEDATVTANLTSGSASGGKISDDSKTTEINLYAPDSNIEALKDAEGTFNGYITLYGGSTIRFNIFEQSQITLTKNAPTAQTLTFTSDAVELGKGTDAYSAFTGQTVSGAVGDVTYTIDSDDDGVVTSIDDETGAIVLSGEFGTATIKASAAAKEVTEAGVTTPYTATTKTYTITVFHSYTVTFSVNGTPTVLRQESNGGSIDVPEDPDDISGFKFMGWSTSTVALTDVAPSMADLSSGTVTPAADATYYAVYAVQGGTPTENHSSTFTVQQASAPSSPYVNDGSSWTWSNVTFTTEASAKINNTNGSVTFTLPSGGKAKSLTITKTSNTWAGACSVVLKEGSNTLKTFSLGSSSSDTYNFTSTYDHASSYTLTNTTAKDAWTASITFAYTTGGVSYENYCTTIPSYSVTVGSAGYTTYVAANNVSFPDGVTAYIATAINPSTVHLEEVSKVPAGEPIIVKADAGTYNLTVEASSDCDDVSDNILEASDGDVTSDASYDVYALANKESGVGFYLVKAGVTVPEGKAYLKKAAGSGVKEFYSFAEDDADGINSLTPALSEGEGVVYNLAGQRINNSQFTIHNSQLKRGIYIVNGKKIMK